MSLASVSSLSSTLTDAVRSNANRQLQQLLPTTNPATADAPATETATPLTPEAADDGELREAFDTAIGGSFFALLLKSMRQTQGEPSYFHGGRAEEAFQTQLDQVLSEKMAKAADERFTGPMFDLFKLQMERR